MPQSKHGALARLRQTLSAVRQAFHEFLALPALIIAGFLLLAAITNWLDRPSAGSLGGLRAFLAQHVFSSAEGAAGLLTAIAGGVINVTSITITLLLLVVQQSASALGAQVFDQFLRRRENQLYFGYFVGLALFALIMLTTVNTGFVPVIGGTLALLGTTVGLFLLLVLFYTTINQTRPVAIVEAIHDRTLAARQRQLDLVRRTQRTARLEGAFHSSVHLDEDGFVTGINLDLIGEAVQAAQAAVEARLHVSIGSYVAYQDRVAEIVTTTQEDGARLQIAVARAIRLGRQRDLDSDPALGIEELENIGWTSISTSKQTPDPGNLAILHLRDLLARCSNEEGTNDEDAVLPLVYLDTTVPRLFDALETLAVVATESMQHQNYAAVVTALATLLPRMPVSSQARTDDLVRRILTGLGDMVLTAELEQRLTALSDALDATGRHQTSLAVETALQQMQATVGDLHSRSTRASAAANRANPA